MLFSLMLACAWTPPVDTGADPVLTTIAGTVTVSGADELGPVFVLLYDANDPPPPSGSGSNPRRWWRRTAVGSRKPCGSWRNSAVAWMIAWLRRPRRFATASMTWR